MLCKNCGATMDNMNYCENCGFNTNNLNINETNSQNISNQVKKKSPINKKIIILSILIVGIIIGTICFLLNLKPDRSETLVSLEKNEYLKFTINEQDYYLGDKVSDFSTNLYYDDNFEENTFVYSDSISTRTFYNENDKKLFLGALYCSSKDNCEYSDTILVKANFYDGTDVVINDYIKFGMSYDDIVEKYGKEDGKFYQNSELLVWTFSETHEIGEPYYILRFDTGSWFNTGELMEIRIGVWWYEGEYEHIVVHDDSEVNN